MHDGEVIINYSGVTIPHKSHLPVKFVAPPVPGFAPEFLTQDGGSIEFAAAITSWVEAFAASFDSTTDVASTEVYAIDEETQERTFIWGQNVVAEGTGVTANIPYVEGVFVFKTVSGKPLKIYTMEGTYAAGVRNVGSVPADGRSDIVDYILSPDNWICGQSGTYPLLFKTFTSKVNDVLRRRGIFQNA